MATGRAAVTATPPEVVDNLQVYTQKNNILDESTAWSTDVNFKVSPSKVHHLVVVSV